MSIDTVNPVASHRPGSTSGWRTARVVAVVLPGAGPGVLDAIGAQTHLPDSVVLVRHEGGGPAEQALPDGADAAVRGRTVLLEVAPQAPVDAMVAAAMDAAEPELVDLFTDASPVGRAATDRASIGGALTDGASTDGAPAQSDADPGTWLWLLTGEGEPEPAALHHLLAAVETAPSVAVAGCKQVHREDRQRLRDVGFSVTRLGAISTGLDRFELDQGQHDSRSDVYAVRLDGMLVRSDVWRELGGPARALGGRAAAADLCRRARGGNHRVVVVPEAVLAGAERNRFALDRRDAVRLRMAWLPGLAVLPALIWTALAGLGRALGWLALKRPERSAAELAAASDVWLRPQVWWRLRRGRRGRRGGVPAGSLSALRPGLRDHLRRYRDELTSWIRPADTVRDPRAGRLRPGLIAALPVLLLALVAGLVAARPILLGSGSVVGPVLAPLPESATRLWNLATGSWRPIDLGQAAIADPLAGLLSLLSWPVLGDPDRLVAVLLAGSPVLAAITAYLAAFALGRGRVTRIWLALAWAAAPSLLAGTLGGSPGAVLVHVIAPLLVLALVRTSTGAGSVTAAAGAGLLLAASIAAVPYLAVPAVALTVVAALAGAAGVPGGQRPLRRIALSALVLVVPLVTLLPWWLAAIADPRLLVADPAAGASGAAGAPSQAGDPSSGMLGLWHLAGLPGRPEPVFAVPDGSVREALHRFTMLPSGLETLSGSRWAGAVALAWVVPPAVIAIGAFTRRGRWFSLVVAGWAVALIGLATAYVVERLPFAPGRPGPGAALTWMLAGLLVAAAVGAGPLGRRVRRAGRPLRALALPLLIAVFAAGPLLALTCFAAQGYQPVTPATARRAEPGLPAVVVAEARSAAGTRTLVLQFDRSPSDGSSGSGSAGSAAAATMLPNTLRWTLSRDGAAPLGADSFARRLAPDAGQDVVLPMLQTLLNETGQDQRAALTAMAIGNVVLLPGEGATDESVSQALDASPGLVRVNSATGLAMWRVTPAAREETDGRPSTARVLNADGTLAQNLLSTTPGQTRVRTTVEDGAAGRRLVLAEHSDTGWVASLDGVDLTPVTVGGWAQGFELPRHGGALQVRHETEPRWLSSGGFAWVWFSAMALFAVLALPLPRVRDRFGPPVSPTPTRPVRRDPATGDPMAGTRPVPQVFDEQHPEQGDLPPLLSDGDAAPASVDLSDAEPGDAEPGDAEPGDAEPGDADPGGRDSHEVDPGGVDQDTQAFEPVADDEPHDPREPIADEVIDLRPAPHPTEQGRTEQGRTGQGRTGQGRDDQDGTSS